MKFVIDAFAVFGIDLEFITLLCVQKLRKGFEKCILFEKCWKESMVSLKHYKIDHEHEHG